MNLGLSEHVALVTGSSQGIGRAIARQLAQEGAYIAVTYRHSKERAEDLVSEIQLQNGTAIALQFDLASLESITAITNAVLAKWGRIDILVNNAIQWSRKPISQSPAFENFPPEEWQSLLRANIEGTFAMLQSVIPSMRKRGWGRIVNVSATLAEDGLPGSGWYTAAKASLHGLTRTLSKELGPSGILVNAVMPGLTATDRISLIAPEVRRRVEETLPIRRILLPEDVALPIVFLCSHANSAITGEIIRVSGGRA